MIVEAVEKLIEFVSKFPEVKYDPTFNVVVEGRVRREVFEPHYKLICLSDKIPDCDLFKSGPFSFVRGESYPSTLIGLLPDLTCCQGYVLGEQGGHKYLEVPRLLVFNNGSYFVEREAFRDPHYRKHLPFFVQRMSSFFGDMYSQEAFRQSQIQ